MTTNRSPEAALNEIADRLEALSVHGAAYRDGVDNVSPAVLITELRRAAGELVSRERRLKGNRGSAIGMAFMALSQFASAATNLLPPHRHGQIALIVSTVGFATIGVLFSWWSFKIIVAASRP